MANVSKIWWSPARDSRLPPASTAVQRMWGKLETLDRHAELFLILGESDLLHHAWVMLRGASILRRFSPFTAARRHVSTMATTTEKPAQPLLVILGSTGTGKSEVGASSSSSR